MYVSMGTACCCPFLLLPVSAAMRPTSGRCSMRLMCLVRGVVAPEKDHRACALTALMVRGIIGNRSRPEAFVAFALSVRCATAPSAQGTSRWCTAALWRAILQRPQCRRTRNQPPERFPRRRNSLRQTRTQLFSRRDYRNNEPMTPQNSVRQTLGGGVQVAWLAQACVTQDFDLRYKQWQGKPRPKSPARAPRAQRA